MSISKQILAYLREGDFAHPGEVEAIQLAMAPVTKKKEQWLLDVGCGLGGTAHYLQQQGYGKVLGIDIDESVLAHARQRYPECQFQLADAMKAGDLKFQQRFEVIYFFSSFFSIPQQPVCLANMHHLAGEQAELVIFDYSLLQKTELANPFPWSKTVKHCLPIYLPEFEKTLMACGWQLKDSLDLTPQFQLWYQQLLGKFREKKKELHEKFDASVVQTMYQGYENLLSLMEMKKMGGIVVYAHRI